MFRLSLVLIVLLSSCQRIAVAPISPLVGKWTPESVVCDGVPEPGWSDVLFEFKQLAKDSGSFQLNYTPNDTLWKTSGYWKVLNDNQIKRSDRINMSYAVNANKLQIAFYVPLKSKQRPCTPAPNNPCITIAYGSFVFSFLKENWFKSSPDTYTTRNTFLSFQLVLRVCHVLQCGRLQSLKFDPLGGSC